MPGAARELAVLDDRVADLLDSLERTAALSQSQADQLRHAAASYAQAFDEEFGCSHDTFRLIGQDNIRRYRPIERLRIRIHEKDEPFDILARVLAGRSVSCAMAISTPPGSVFPFIDALHDATEDWAAAIEFVEEDDATLAAAIRFGQVDRVRFAAPDRVPELVQQAAAEVGSFLATEPPLGVGRIELLHVVREQSLCIDYHRYGNLGVRAAERRDFLD